MSATTSNTYLFGTNTQLDDLFRDAFERIGIIGNEQVALHVQSAIMSSNLELSSWPGRGLNLWLVQKRMIGLYPNQPTYTLPVNTVRILEAVATQPQRLNTGGTAFSSAVASGLASNCFTNNNNTGCTLNGPNGYIGYNYGSNPNSIIYVGITPLAQATYTLVVDYSFDNANWFTIYTAPSQTYFANQVTWFVIENSLNAQLWRIRETGGATLAIQFIYFDQPTTQGTGDRLLSTLSRSSYMAVSTKMTTGYPSGYYYDGLISPTITLWPVPPANYIGNLLYTGYSYVQDVTQMFQTVNVPQRFYDAFVAGLAARLSLKFKTDMFQLLKAEAQEAYAIAAKTDFENVSLNFNPNLSGSGGGS